MFQGNNSGEQELSSLLGVSPVIHNYRPVKSAVSYDKRVVYFALTGMNSWYTLVWPQGSSFLLTEFKFPHRNHFGSKIISGYYSWLLRCVCKERKKNHFHKLQHSIPEIVAFHSTIKIPGAKQCINTAFVHITSTQELSHTSPGVTLLSINTHTHTFFNLMRHKVEKHMYMFD